MSPEQSLITRIKNRYLLLRALEISLLALSLAILAFVIANFISNNIMLSWLLSLMAGIVTIIARVSSLHLYPFHASRITFFLNRQYPELESSADLLSQDHIEFSSLQKMQRSNVFTKLQALEKDIRFPHFISYTLISFILSIGILLASKSFTLPFLSASQKVIVSDVKISAKENASNIVTLGEIKITINPPAYTKVLTTTSSNLSLKIVEGTRVKWNFGFNGTPEDIMLILSGKDSVKLKDTQGFYSLEHSFFESGFYQYIWTDPEKRIHQSDYFAVEVTIDEAPQIAVENLTQFIELKLTDRLVVNLNATLRDDFGLTDAQIIATVSKGSGESVKFREEKLRFTQPVSFSGKLQHASRSIDLVKLGLEPGDELYFYIEAFDTKTPAFNRSRTETFFISLQDTVTYEVAEDAGLGVDVLPEYFRSQIQIIIDTEKLLGEKKNKAVTVDNFKHRSNDLGSDQNILRLRYSQFMGEENEGLETHDDDHPSEDEKPEDIIKSMGHSHDTENEQNLVAEKPASEKPLDEEAFLQQSVTAKLKIAVSMMWDAELQLRLHQPDKSLPVQYKILKLLKEISNDSRVYVHRSGFDAPPLKEEKRLSGDLSELKNSSNQFPANTKESHPEIRKALNIIQVLLPQKRFTLSTAEHQVLQKAGNELASAALQNPATYLKSLSTLKSLLSGDLKGQETISALQQIQQSFWTIVQRETVSPSALRTTPHTMDAKFLQQLEALKHNR